jgi:hypothetical protein
VYTKAITHEKFEILQAKKQEQLGEKLLLIRTLPSTFSSAGFKILYCHETGW